MSWLPDVQRCTDQDQFTNQTIMFKTGKLFGLCAFCFRFVHFNPSQSFLLNFTVKPSVSLCIFTCSNSVFTFNAFINYFSKDVFITFIYCHWHQQANTCKYTESILNWGFLFNKNTAKTGSEGPIGLQMLPNNRECPSCSSLTSHRCNTDELITSFPESHSGVKVSQETTSFHVRFQMSVKIRERKFISHV